MKEEENTMKIILDTDKKTITVPHNYTDKLNAINSMIKEFGGADRQLKTAARPAKAAAPKAAPKPGVR